MEGKKSNKGLIGLIIFLIIIILGLVTYMVYPLIIKDNKNETKEKNNNEIVEKNDNEKFDTVAKKLIANNILNIMSINACGRGYQYDFTNRDVIEYKDLSEDEKVNMTYHYLYNFYHYPEELSNNDLVLAYKNLFGVENYKFPNKINIYSSFTTYELGEYAIYKLSAAGGGCMSSSLYEMYNYGVDDDKFFVDVIYYVNDIDPEYGDKSYITNSFKDPDFKFEKNSSNVTDSDLEKIKENKDKFTKYRFTFKISNDNYIFDNIKKI